MPARAELSNQAASAAAQANEEIRVFMRERLGRPLRPEEQAEYGRLLSQWSAARNGVATAA
jgi:hypothetical protein